MNENRSTPGNRLDADARATLLQGRRDRWALPGARSAGRWHERDLPLPRPPNELPLHSHDFPTLILDQPHGADLLRARGRHLGVAREAPQRRPLLPHGNGRQHPLLVSVVGSRRGRHYADLRERLHRRGPLRYTEALIDYEAAIGLDAEYATAYVNKRVLHTERDEWDDALRAFETAARLGNNTGKQYADEVRQIRALRPARCHAERRP
jgi:tetratricopeptide (TPR) repeat protein